MLWFKVSDGSFVGSGAHAEDVIGPHRLEAGDVFAVANEALEQDLLHGRVIIRSAAGDTVRTEAPPAQEPIPSVEERLATLQAEMADIKDKLLAKDRQVSDLEEGLAVVYLEVSKSAVPSDT